MAREFPIHNGRMTTDLDANGHKIKNLPPGSGFTQVQSDWGQTDTTAPDFIKNKPTIPAPVTIDPALSPTSENPVQNKVVTKALAAKLDGAAAYPAWDSTAHYLQGIVVSYGGRLWKAKRDIPYPPPDAHEPPPDYDDAPWDEVFLKDLKQDALSSAQMAAANSGATAAKVATWDGYAAQIAQKANASDVNEALALKANTSDLPYALVTPGEWEFSEGNYEIFGPNQDGDVWKYTAGIAESQAFSTEAEALSALVLYFVHEPSGTSFTATRASLPGHLLDRANNLIDATTGDVALTLPAYQDGKVRDLLVHVDLGGDGTNPYAVTVNFPSGETNTGFKVKGNASAPIPAPDAAGEWLFSFSECAPHKMAVALAQLQDATVAGGS